MEMKVTHPSNEFPNTKLIRAITVRPMSAAQCAIRKTISVAIYDNDVRTDFTQF